jgi:hypothetical protein
MSSLATNAITDASGGNTTTINGYTPTVSNMAGRNRIINGDMRIDQRNAGASFSPTTSSGFSLDRWAARITQNSKLTIQQNAGAVTPPAGYTNYLGVTSSSAYSVLSTDVFTLAQPIEGFNVADLGFGTAGAQSVTLSFWVRSSLTGSFGGALVNSAANRSYSFLYTISAANTWTSISITVPGDTTGTWLTNNGAGIEVRFGLGAGSNFTGTANAWGTANAAQPPSTVSVVGTSGATFYVTGVQLEAGSVATPFEHRQYGQELALCQRYYEQYDGVIYPIDVNLPDTSHTIHMAFSERKRSAPTITLGSGTNLDVLYARTDHDQTHGVGITTSHSSTSQGKIESPAWIASAEL